ncbi:putative membrane protein [Mumia flava]|uniref:Putative membrane protein n=1 Tax=Mumia flava TaxID=1348852 RepID=A0A0B2BP50_9ACTN|nr:YhgE/Pip family protein [Mumia flava]PJJ57096.1 putative membrane protein [Mumia flava]
MSERRAVRRGGRRATWIRVLAVGVLLPLAAAAVLVWSTSDRVDRVDRIPVAVVNGDIIITDPQPMAAGRALTASLTDPTTSAPDLDWILTDATDADEGLRTGRYYAVLTIPSDFSKAILSTGTDDPEQGALTLVGNAAASVSTPYLSAQIADAAARSLGRQSTEGYLTNVYAGFNQIAKSNKQAAQGAAQLAAGTEQLADGADELADGAESLASGLDQLATGAAELSTGVDAVSSGASATAVGARGVAAGAASLDAGAGRIALSADRLSTGGSGLATASDEIARGAGLVAEGETLLADRARLLAEQLQQLRRDCRAAGATVRFCTRLGRARTRALVVEGGTRLSERATEGLARATNRVAGGAVRLADGQARLARGAGRLDAAGGRLSEGAERLASGAGEVASGAVDAARASGELADGAQSSAEGGASLASGATTLASSAGQVDDGAHQLSDGLAQEAAQIPTYGSAQQTALADVVSEPVVLTSTVEHAEHGNGWLLGAILGAVLWLAALVSVQTVDPAAIRRDGLAPVASRRIALTMAAPVLGLAVVQAVAVMVAVVLLHPSTASTLPLALLCGLAAVAFTVVAFAVRLALGGAGVAVLVLLLALQLAALSNVLPLETAPEPLQSLNAVMPLTAFVNGASRLVAGGEVMSVLASVSVLVIWTLAAGLLAVAVVKKRRQVPLAPAPAPA